VITPLVLVRLDYGVSRSVTPGLIATLTAAAALAALPFLAAGIVIALAIKSYMSSVGRVYAFDLAGAALGAVAIVPLLYLASAPTLLVALGMLAGLAAVLFGWDAPRVRAVGLAVVGVAAVAAVLAATTSRYYLPTPLQRATQRAPISDRWTPISRVVGYAPVRNVPFAILTYDSDYAPVPVYRRGTPYPDWHALGLGPQSIGHALTPPGRVLVIGGGGGRDIFNVLSSGHPVDVIELNKAIRAVVDRELGHWSGAPYTLPGVRTSIGDGRATLAARNTKYEQVHIGFTNTLTASFGAAYALSENNLYTVEAFKEYFDHLRPGGLLSVSRLYRFTGEEALRATVLALKTLEERGVAHPERNVVVLLGKSGPVRTGTVLARMTPFTAAELRVVRRLADERSDLPRGQSLVYAPGGPYRLEWRGLRASGDVDSFCAGYRTDVCPPTDDRPFFFNQTRLGDLFGAAPPGTTFLSRGPAYILLAVLGILAVMAVLAFVLPLRLVRGAGRPPVSALSFFAAIGAGYLVLEIVLIQRFVLLLGFPTYALSVVLFALLVFTGAGSSLSARWRDPRRALGAALAGVAVLIAALAFGLQPLIESLVDKPFALRVAVAVAVLAPVGIGLGMAMPIGLRRLAGLYPAAVPWAWSINGITSVLASVLALTVAINWGFEVATLLALACYLAALAHARFGRWPAGEIAGRD
jgi:hypothetical protein